MGPPMGHVGIDLFDSGGKKFLVCVDQWSGYPVFQKLNSTTASILNVLTGWLEDSASTCLCTTQLSLK